ncbi:hypothetical protein RFI_05167 [Reticulomyxa filosa]|uniref:Uncharacterized protein n=1 Tax=Reticulomyxa filosa TaxID=46433 RepID=X6P065_RETFI|nr:hypothetical protein RFI_05167 [Reticulomyxa filosa]|eukprot:ETO31950.1 hypothetical protein RFI_05167 [Reticulomyxa filosa]
MFSSTSTDNPTSPRDEQRQDLTADLLQKFSEHLSPDDKARVERHLNMQDNELQKQWYLHRNISGLIKAAGESKQETEIRRATNKALGYLSTYEKIIDINFTERSDKRTLLHTACYFNNLTVVRFILLFYRAAQIDLEDKYGQTPLDLAVERQHGEIIETFEAFKVVTCTL